MPARRSSRRRRRTRGVTYRVRRARRAAVLTTASVDLVTVAQALHWLAAQRSTTRSAACSWRRPPRGVVLWHPAAGRPEADRRLQAFYGSVVGPYWAPERRLVETGYRTVPFPFEELPAPTFEMVHDWPLPELLAYLRTWSATSAFVKARGFDPVEALGESWRRIGAPATAARGPLAPQPPHRQAPPTRLNFGLAHRRLAGARRCRP